MAENKLNALDTALENVRIACEDLNLDPAVYEILRKPERVMEVSIPVKMNDGSTRVFTGYRSQHNTALGPSIGGVRYSEKVYLDEVKALSVWMTFKCSLVGLPLGGGKTGVIVDPTELSQGELERLSREYVRRVFPFTGENLDLAGPDMNTNIQTMTWMMDEYAKLKGDQTVGVYTRKPVGLHGTVGGEESTGIGISIAVRELLKNTGKSIEGATIAIQGFGNVGKTSTKHLQNRGAKVVAISDWDKEVGAYALYKEDGFDFEEALAEKEKNHTLRGIPGVKEISVEEFWALDVDVLIPAVMEDTITPEVAELINAPLIVEGANGPTTKDADKVLNKKGIIAAPDILVNSGGVIVSYFEWVQNKYGYYWTYDEVSKREEDMMVEAIKNVWEIKEKHNVSMRKAAYMYSVGRVAEAMKLRGWY